MQGQPTGMWAKLEQSPDHKILAWHPLLAHSADVAAMLEALLTRTLLGNRLAALIGQSNLSPVQIARLCVLAAIHDAGKANHGFQRKGLREGSPRSWANHLTPLIDALNSRDPEATAIAEALGIYDIAADGWFEDDDLEPILLATWGHHGSPIKAQYSFDPTLWTATEQRDPLAELTRLKLAIRTWFPDAFNNSTEPFPTSTPFQHAFNGLLTLADWLASDIRFFPFAKSLDDRIADARSFADKAVRAFDLDPTPTRKALDHILENRPLGFDRISPYPPRPLQQAFLDIPLHTAGSLVTLESDTGSGKTEAAILYYLRLFQAGLVDGMYFALPTRSAASQIYRRVHEAVQIAFGPDHAPPVVQAVAGYIAADNTTAERLPEFKVLWNDDDRERWRYRGWAAEHPKRYFAAPVAIGTIDQALLSCLKVSHAEMRATALTRQLLVIDEVHASDTYMGKLLEFVLDHHLATGGHALLMSATLGSALRSRLENPVPQHPPSPDLAAAFPYPLIRHSDASRKKPQSIAVPPAAYSKTVDLTTAPQAENPADIAQLAIAAAADGARVLIIRNTVAGCLAVQHELETLLPSDSPLLFGIHQTPAPHHSRFAADDRKSLDLAIEQAFGKDSTRQQIIAVATQTVEQSLDIDADILITDLCPIDVLLQRIGRLHRHADRTRPAGFERAQCIVLLPEVTTLEPYIVHDGQGKGPHGLGTVYSDLRILEATWKLIDDQPTWTIPAMNRQLVEAATHPEILQQFAVHSDAWQLHNQEVSGKKAAHNSIADLHYIDRKKPFGDQTFSRETSDKIQTRLGENDRLIHFDPPFTGPFGNTISQLKTAERFCRGALDDALPTDIQHQPGTTRFRFGPNLFIYDRHGLRLDSSQ